MVRIYDPVQLTHPRLREFAFEVAWISVVTESANDLEDLNVDVPHAQCLVPDFSTPWPWEFDSVATASGAVGKAACTASPTTLNSTPPWASIAIRSRCRWRSTAPAIALADDPIHHTRYPGCRESYKTIVRAATCLINDGSGNPLKGLQDAFDHCRGPSQFGRHGGGLFHLERHPGRSSAAVGCATWESSSATTRRRSTPRPWPPGAVVIPRALAEVLQRAFSGGVGRGNRK